MLFAGPASAAVSMVVTNINQKLPGWYEVGMFPNSAGLLLPGRLQTRWARVDELINELEIGDRIEFQRTVKTTKRIYSVILFLFIRQTEFYLICSLFNNVLKWNFVYKFFVLFKLFRSSTNCCDNSSI